MIVPTIDLGNGAILCTVSDFIHHYPACAQRTFFSQKDINIQVCAESNRGIVLYVPAGVHVKKVIDLNLLQQHSDSLLFEQMFIVVKRGASVTIFDYTCPETQSIMGWIYENAHVIFVRDRQIKEKIKAISNMHFYVGKNASLEMYFLTTGNGFSKDMLDVRICAKGANVKVRGAYVLSGAGSGDFTVHQNHEAAHTISTVIVKNIARERAQTMYRGVIHIPRDVMHVDAKQENKNLLLSSSARAYSMPEIEALNNEVCCMHGSAIGHVDEELLFYVQTRGLSKNVAQRILIQGFLCDVFGGVPSQLHNSLKMRILDALI